MGTSLMKEQGEQPPVPTRKKQQNPLEVNGANRINKMDKMLRLLLHQKGATTKFKMKIVIRGERRSGKSSLIRRLQGLEILNEYIPTPEIESHVINWTYKNDYVKVDFWDTVDVGLPPSEGNDAFESIGTVVDPDKLAGIPKQSNGFGAHKVGVLDTRVIDPYVGSQGVIFIFNPYTKSSLQYLKTESEKVPCGLPILVLSSFADLDDQNTSNSSTQVSNLCRQLHFSRQSSVHMVAISLKTGQGLKTLHDYLKIPFLNMRKLETESLLRNIVLDLDNCENEMIGLSSYGSGGAIKNSWKPSTLKTQEKTIKTHGLKLKHSTDSYTSHKGTDDLNSLGSSDKVENDSDRISHGERKVDSDFVENLPKDWKEELDAFLADVESDDESKYVKRKERQRITECVRKE